MSDEDDGHPCASPDLQQFALQLLAGERIERAEWFVHQECTGIVGEDARDRHPLLHAARELVRIAVGSALEAHELDVLVGDRVGLPARQLALARTEANVLPDRHPGE